MGQFGISLYILLLGSDSFATRERCHAALLDAAHKDRRVYEAVLRTIKHSDAEIARHCRAICEDYETVVTDDEVMPDYEDIDPLFQQSSYAYLSDLMKLWASHHYGCYPQDNSPDYQTMAYLYTRELVKRGKSPKEVRLYLNALKGKKTIRTLWITLSVTQLHRFTFWMRQPFDRYLVLPY